MDRTDRPAQHLRRSSHELWHVLFARAHYVRYALQRLQDDLEKLTLTTGQPPDTSNCDAATIAAVDQLHALYRDFLLAAAQEDWRTILARWPAEPTDLLVPGHLASADPEPLTFTVLLRLSDPPAVHPVIRAIHGYYQHHMHPLLSVPLVVDLDAAPREVLDMLLQLVRVRDMYRGRRAPHTRFPRRS
jgi:hypothetical protein